MSEEILYNKLYERTKDFGRTQFVREIMRLQQENQQLKEELENNDFKTTYNQFVNYQNWYFEYVDKCEKYKSVLDEIREYIEHEWFKRGQLGIIDKSFQEWQLRDILQILDKVKE